MWSRVALLVGFGCGRIGFDATPGVGDGGIDAIDAPGGPDAACTWSAFSAPVRLPVISTGFDEWGGAPFLGETRIMFHSYRTANADLFEGSRATTAVQFGNVTAVASLNTAVDQWSPSLTEDGLDLVYAINPGAADYEIAVASRATPSSPFSSQLAAELNSGAHDFGPALSADGLRLIFTSERSGIRELYETTRPDRNMPFAAEVLLPLGGGGATDPTMSRDALQIWFSSRRAGGPGMYDVWTATRPAIGQPFGAPVLVPELSSARDDIALRLAFDGRTMYLDFDTLTVGGGAADIWTATRSCL